MLSKLLRSFLVEAFQNENLILKFIDFSTFDLKAGKIRISGKVLFWNRSANDFLRVQVSFSKKENVCEKFIFFQILFGILKKASAFRGKIFGMFPTTLIVVSRRLFCNTATLQHFWILSETCSTSDKIWSSGFSRVDSTCPEKRFYNFIFLKKKLSVFFGPWAIFFCPWSKNVWQGCQNCILQVQRKCFTA